MNREYIISHQLLQQVQILELAQGAAAAAAGTILSDLGANVVKLVLPETDFSELDIRLNHRGKSLLQTHNRKVVDEALSRADILITDFTQTMLKEIGLDRQSSTH